MGRIIPYRTDAQGVMENKSHRYAPIPQHLLKTLAHNTKDFSKMGLVFLT